MKAKLINAAIGTLQIIHISSLVGFSGMVLAIGMQGCNNNRCQSNFEQLGYKYQQVFKDELRKMGLESIKNKCLFGSKNNRLFFTAAFAGKL